MEEEQIPSNIRAAVRLLAAAVKRSSEKKSTNQVLREVDTAKNNKFRGDYNKNLMPLFLPSGMTSAVPRDGKIPECLHPGLEATDG